MFVTIEDETGDVQVIVWRDLFAGRRRELDSQVVEVMGAGVTVGWNYERDSDGLAGCYFGCRHADVAMTGIEASCGERHCRHVLYCIFPLCLPILT